MQSGNETLWNDLDGFRRQHIRHSPAAPPTTSQLWPGPKLRPLQPAMLVSVHAGTAIWLRLQCRAHFHGPADLAFLNMPDPSRSFQSVSLKAFISGWAAPLPRKFGTAMAGRALLSRWIVTSLCCAASAKRTAASAALLGLRLLRRHDSVFRCLGYPKLHHLFGGDLDSLAGRRVTAHACLAIHADQPPYTGQHEYAILLDLADGRLGKGGEKALRNLLANLALLCQCLDDLRLRHHSPFRLYADEHHVSV